ncbi:MAG: helix-turn-helix transcriptional regulator [Planctomycetota bacterium]|jgi:predicted ArsR family transcriptional regulator
MTTSRERILHLLKTKGPQSAAQLAKRLKITPMAVRQHLAALEGLVTFDEERHGVGRPRRVWRLSETAQGRFPDCHGELAVGMLEAMRAAFGQRGLDKLVAERTKAQIKSYRSRMPEKGTPVRDRVAALAAIRRDEGYMAEWSRARDGTFLLIENHCPICAAAEACQGLCRGELELFRKVLGAPIERTEHILEGARRCVYRIAP